ncbi:hypothetical protein LSTR_LSTR004542 [Laodelphax striatellus]|uniref:Uncharacterized protein n=1 Tax=Laodelphax striatellus TaxID=195883 RepID=A0A482WTL8_LAOST|nr:hypothetical protein LSTR_LSTR004542 [Laodelphax striatellus]
MRGEGGVGGEKDDYKCRVSISQVVRGTATELRARSPTAHTAASYHVHRLHDLSLASSSSPSSSPNMCRRAHSPTPAISQPQISVQIKRPCLVRKLVGSARINLNDYWKVLEATMDPHSNNCENENIDNERKMANLRIKDTNNERVAMVRAVYFAEKAAQACYISHGLRRIFRILELKRPATEAKGTE